MIDFNRRRIMTTGALAAAGLTTAVGPQVKGANLMPIERKNYPHLDAPVGPYVHAVSYNGLLFLSGLTAFNTPAQDGDLAVQAEVVFDQLQQTLEAEGNGFENLLKVTIFVTEFEDLERFREVLLTAYQEYLPASALIQVRGLFAPEVKIEVEAIAAI
ncbi:MAG: RidA family protein [Cyanobacteria bacterium J06626_18]